MLLNVEIYNLCKEANSLKPRKLKSRINTLSNKLKKEWMDIMVQLGLYNKAYNTFSLNNITFENYGFKCNIFIVSGLTFKKLEDKIDTIQDNLGCLITFNKSKSSKFIQCKFIFNNNKDNEYQIVKQTKPYELYIGNSVSSEPILIDMKKYANVGIYGMVRSGKSKMMDCILTNLITNISPTQVNLYLCQIAKSDLILYEDVIHTKGFADSLEKAYILLDYIVNIIMVQRDNDIRPYRKKALADNYHDYNNLKYTDYMPTIIVAFDETSSLFDSKGDKKEVKDLKSNIVSLIESIAQYGGGLGVFFITSLQRPTADNISPFVKAMSTCKISFRQNNNKSSEIAMDDGQVALGLEQREFVYSLAGKIDYGYVPYINNKYIYSVIKDYIKPNHQTAFDIIKKMNKRVKKGKEKVEQIKIKKEEDILKENISKIEGYVPYDNGNGKKLIKDESKPYIKKGKEIVNDNR